MWHVFREDVDQQLIFMALLGKYGCSAFLCSYGNIWMWLDAFPSAWKLQWLTVTMVYACWVLQMSDAKIFYIFFIRMSLQITSSFQLISTVYIIKFWLVKIITMVSDHIKYWVGNICNTFSFGHVWFKIKLTLVQTLNFLLALSNLVLKMPLLFLFFLVRLCHFWL